jgi:hypothetical protein
VRKKFQQREKPDESLWEKIEEAAMKEYQQKRLERRQAKED